MANFRYVAKDAQGHSIGGALEAVDKDAAVALLHKQGLTILTLSLEKAKRSVGKRVKQEDIVIFSRQMATMVDSGITLVQCLSILGEQLENSGLASVIQSVQRDIESGSSFHAALAKHPAVFSDIYINMVNAGEASGKLDEILDRVASYLEKAIALERKVKSALIYPAVVISMAIIITAILLIKVVPTFKGIFDSLGGTLPLPTQILIGISNILQHYFIYAILVVGLVVFLFKRYISTEVGRRQFDQATLKFPIIGELLRKVAIAKFSRTLATLVRSGVPIINALGIVGKTSGNKVVEEAILNSCTAIKEGESIAGPLMKGKVFPPMVVRMISVGEKTGQLEKMLNKIGDFYDEQVDAAVSGLTSLIEPLVIAFLGIIIGGIVIALFMPIFKITQLIGK